MERKSHEHCVWDMPEAGGGGVLRILIVLITIMFIEVSREIFTDS